MGFDTTQPGAAPGGDPLSGASAIDNTGQAPVGPTPVPAGSQKVGVDMAILFQATRVAVAPAVDYSNSLCKIHVNNWTEVNHLWFHEFTAGAGCCQPIDTTLTVQFVTDHEMLHNNWALAITSCSGSAPGNIPVPNPTPGVTFTAGDRGATGSIVEATGGWTNCSYTAHLSTQPALTTGLADRGGVDNQLTFCICGHKH